MTMATGQQQRGSQTETICFHCGLAIPSGIEISATIADQTRQFCCAGCAAVAEMIAGAGLDKYYRFYQPAGEAVDQQRRQQRYQVFDQESFQQRFVDCRQPQQYRLELLLPELHCAACVWLVERFLQRQPGVISAQVNLDQQRLSLCWDPQQTALSRFCEYLAELGYPPEPFTVKQQQLQQQQESHRWLRRIGVAGLGMMQVGMFSIALYAGELQQIANAHRLFLQWTSWLVTTVVMLYAAAPFFRNAWLGLRQARAVMDLPVAVAIAMAWLASTVATVSGEGEVYFDSIVMVTFLLLGGRYLEMRARHSSARAQQSLLSLLPEMVLQKGAAGELQLTPLYQIKPGDQIVVKAGEMLAVDGIVAEGSSALDESQLTGEFMPRSCALGDRVVAGSINGDSMLVITVSAVGDDCQMAAIDGLLQQGRDNKPRMAQFADRLAQRFILLVLTLAGLTWLGWQWLDPERAFAAMLAVLVVSCPCALALATPTVLTVATRRLRESGILVTRGAVWEQLANINHLVCDKTGTLTEGKLSLGRVLPLAEWDTAELLAMASALEQAASHPIAAAFDGIKPATIALNDWQLHVAAGVSARANGQLWRLGTPTFCQQTLALPDTVNHWLLLCCEQQAVGWIEVLDPLRADAADFIQRIRSQQQWPVSLYSGDHSGRVAAVAGALALDQAVAAMTPADKLRGIQHLQQQGHSVLMLGDGINDVPVLAAADVSIAMAEASDLAKTQADCILLNGRLQSVELLLTLAAETRRRLRQNVYWALSYNLLAMPLAAAGLVPPWLAAAGMSLSSLVVVLNAMRLQRWPLPAATAPQPLLQGGAAHG